MALLWLQKEKSNGNGEAEEEDLPELASLSNRFSYFENFNEKEETRKKKSRGGDEEGNFFITQLKKIKKISKHNPKIKN